jgi:hypothetical protein
LNLSDAKALATAVQKKVSFQIHRDTATLEVLLAATNPDLGDSKLKLLPAVYCQNCGNNQQRFSESHFQRVLLL